MTNILSKDTFKEGFISEKAITVIGDVTADWAAFKYGQDNGGFRITSVDTPVDPADASNKAYTDSKATPTGAAIFFAGSTVPSGWLVCSGQLVSRTTYAALFAVIGTTYGAGDGSTTFAVPAMEAMVGVGASFVVRSYIIKT